MTVLLVTSSSIYLIFALNSLDQNFLIHPCILHCAGDFDVPSSREDVDRDSSWNQWLRNEIHILFLEALEIFKVRHIYHLKTLKMY